MNQRRLNGQRLCALCGFVMLALFAPGMILAGFIPPPGANLSVHQTALFYSEHTDRLRLGLTFIIAAAGFYAPWSGAVSVQLKRIEGQFSPFAYTELVTGAANFLVIMIPAYVMLAAAFRPLRDPQITQALNDMGMIPFIGAFPPTIIANLAIAGAILTGERKDIYPRWIAWLNLGCIPLLLPAVAIPFVTSGAFAWQGLFEFWLAAIVFFGWFTVMTVMTLRAIAQQRDGQVALAGAAVPEYEEALA
jgi:hypothetical protein